MGKDMDLRTASESSYIYRWRGDQKMMSIFFGNFMKNYNWNGMYNPFFIYQKICNSFTRGVKMWPIFMAHPQYLIVNCKPPPRGCRHVLCNFTNLVLQHHLIFYRNCLSGQIHKFACVWRSPTLENKVSIYKLVGNYEHVCIKQLQRNTKFVKCATTCVVIFILRLQLQNSKDTRYDHRQHWGRNRTNPKIAQICLFV